MIMKGYDREKALSFMRANLDKKELGKLAAQAEMLLGLAIDTDMAYMQEAGVLTAEGLMGDSYYDDDEAFEFLLERMAKKLRMKEDDQGPLASFIDQYMDLQQQFMEDSGLMGWD